MIAFSNIIAVIFCMMIMKMILVMIFLVIIHIVIIIEIVIINNKTCILQGIKNGL